MLSTKIRATIAALTTVAALSTTGTGVASAAVSAHKSGDAQGPIVQTTSAQRIVRPGQTPPVLTGGTNVTLEGHSTGDKGAASEQTCEDLGEALEGLGNAALGAYAVGNITSAADMMTSIPPGDRGRGSNGCFFID